MPDRDTHPRYWAAYMLMAMAVLAGAAVLILLILAMPLVILAFPLTIGAIGLIVLVVWGRRRLRQVRHWRKTQ